jgi:L-fuconolactonase
MPQYLDEAEWVDGLAAEDRRVLGAVVCLPLERGPSIEPEIARVAKLRTARGVRRLIQNQPDPECMLKPGFLEALRLLPKYNLSFDAAFSTLQRRTRSMMRQCPEFPSSSITSASPGSKPGLIDPWRTHIREMAARNVVATLRRHREADHKTWTRDQLKPHRSCDRLLRPRSYSLRRRLAGVRTCRAICWLSTTGRRPAFRK